MPEPEGGVWRLQAISRRAWNPSDTQSCGTQAGLVYLQRIESSSFHWPVTTHLSHNSSKDSLQQQ